MAHGKSTLVRAVSGINVSNLIFNFKYFRLSAIKKKKFVISQLNWVTPMPNFLNVLFVRLPNAFNHMDQRKKIMQNVNTAILNCFF